MTRIHLPISRRHLLSAVMLAGLSTAALAEQGDPSFLCPDNGSITPIVSNAGGTTDKVLDVDPTGTDTTFTVTVYRASDGAVLDVLEFTDSQPRSVTVPPGAKAKIEDNSDSDHNGPSGTFSFHN